MVRYLGDLVKSNDHDEVHRYLQNKYRVPSELGIEVKGGKELLVPIKAEHLDLSLNPALAANHKCKTAACAEFVETKGGRVDIVALVDISAGSEIFVDYFGGNSNSASRVSFICNCGHEMCIGGGGGKKGAHPRGRPPNCEKRGRGRKPLTTKGERKARKEKKYCCETHNKYSSKKK